MKRLGSVLLFFCLLGFASCKSSYVMTIETQKPAEIIIIPGKENGVVVIHNAIPQPPGQGIALTINKKVTEIGQSLAADTAIWVAVSNFAETIGNENYFDQTLVYNKALRSDGEWLSVLPLPNVLRDSIYAETGCNVIISIDRLLFDMKQAVTTKSEEYFFIDPATAMLYIQCRAVMTCSVYYSEKEKRLTTFTIQDSIFMNNSVFNDSVGLYKTIPDFIVKQLAVSISETAASYFLPGWNVADRIIYTSPNSRMQEADKYFGNRKWSLAREIWKSQYDEKDKIKDKARLSMNIAVSYEMEDSLDLALEWAQLSKKYYDQIDSSKMEVEKNRAGEYVNVLGSRIVNNRILDTYSSDF